jgi:hypothetical protein
MGTERNRIKTRDNAHPPHEPSGTGVSPVRFRTLGELPQQRRESIYDFLVHGFNARISSGKSLPKGEGRGKRERRVIIPIVSVTEV